MIKSSLVPNNFSLDNIIRSSKHIAQILKPNLSLINFGQVNCTSTSCLRWGIVVEGVRRSFINIGKEDNKVGKERTSNIGSNNRNSFEKRKGVNLKKSHQDIKVRSSFIAQSFFFITMRRVIWWDARAGSHG